ACKSAGGWDGVATVAVTRSVAVAPPLSVARATKVWEPADSQVVMRKPRLVQTARPGRTVRSWSLSRSTGDVVSADTLVGAVSTWLADARHRYGAMALTRNGPGDAAPA